MGDFLQDTNNRRLSAFPGATGRNINRDRLISTQSFNKSPPPPLSVFLRTCWIISRSEESRSQYCVTLYVRLQFPLILLAKSQHTGKPLITRSTWNHLRLILSLLDINPHLTDQGHRLCERTERCYTHKKQSMGNTTIL